MEDGKPSQTALMVAMLRARHFLEAPEPKILRDSLALSLSGAANSQELKAYEDGIIAMFTSMSDPETARTFIRRIEDAVCLRARLLEEELAAAKAKGVEQFVILGAGLDSTAYRAHELVSGLNIFEVDHPASQAWKKERLLEIGAEIPLNLTFVPFDFENIALDAALEAGGVDKSKKTVFSWLGVQPYLTDEAVRQTLSVVGSFASGSVLVMDFTMPDTAHNDNLVPDSVDQLAQMVSQMSEPFMSYYTDAELADVFIQSGFSGSDFPTVGNMITQYLGGDNAAAKTPESAKFLAVARV